MSGLFCPNCGKQHNTPERYCSFCGEDLSEAILQYKNKRLPVKLNHTAPENKAELQENSVRYPTGRPLPEPSRSGRRGLLREKREVSTWEVIFCWCC